MPSIHLSNLSIRRFHPVCPRPPWDLTSPHPHPPSILRFPTHAALFYNDPHFMAEVVCPITDIEGRLTSPHVGGVRPAGLPHGGSCRRRYLQGQASAENHSQSCSPQSGPSPAKEAKRVHADSREAGETRQGASGARQGAGGARRGETGTIRASRSIASRSNNGGRRAEQQRRPQSRAAAEARSWCIGRSTSRRAAAEGSAGTGDVCLL